MAAKINWFRGDTLKFQLNLFTNDPNSTLEFVYPIVTGSTIVIHMPAPTGAPVTLSTANVGEITIIDASKGQIGVVCPPAKSALLSVGTSLAIDAVITTPSNEVSTAEKVKVVNIADRINP